MASHWQVRDYRPGDEVGILALFNRVFGADAPSHEPRTVEFWRWQFEANPRGHRCFVAEGRDGRIVGNYAGIPIEMVHEGVVGEGLQVVDTVVDFDFHGTGLFVDLGTRFLRHFCDPERNFVIFGYPNPPAYRAGTRHLGYAPIHRPVQQLVCEFDEAWIDALSRSYNGPPADEWATLDARVDELSARLSGEHAMTTVKSLRYCHWRYVQHPGVDYRYIAALDDDARLAGMVVIRLGWHGHPIVPIVDWMVPRNAPRVVSRLLARVAMITFDAGGRKLETWLPPGSSEFATLVQLGFQPAPSDFSLVTYCDLDPAWCAKNWFFTMGDSDIY